MRVSNNPERRSVFAQLTRAPQAGSGSLLTTPEATSSRFFRRTLTPINACDLPEPLTCSPTSRRVRPSDWTREWWGSLHRDESPRAALIPPDAVAARGLSAILASHVDTHSDSGACAMAAVHGFARNHL